MTSLVASLDPVGENQVQTLSLNRSKEYGYLYLSHLRFLWKMHKLVPW